MPNGSTIGHRRWIITPNLVGILHRLCFFALELPKRIRNIEDVLVVRAEFFQRGFEPKKVFRVWAAGTVALRDVFGELLGTSRAEPCHVGWGGNVNKTFGGCAIEKFQWRCKAQVPVLFSHIEVIECRRGDTIRHAQTLSRLFDKRNNSARRVGSSAVVVRALPKSTRPAMNLCRLSLVVSKVRFIN